MKDHEAAWQKKESATGTKKKKTATRAAHLYTYKEISILPFIISIQYYLSVE
jgi:hypothetical protein